MYEAGVAHEGAPASLLLVVIVCRWLCSTIIGSSWRAVPVSEI